MLNIDNLNISFRNGSEFGRILRNINININKGEKASLIGESGCGKSILALAILNLLPQNFEITGKIFFNGNNILNLKEHHQYRGKLISICWSNPDKYFNPAKTIGSQIAESFLIHNPGLKKEAKEKTLDILAILNFDDPEKTYKSYPYQLSGGMNQRAIIAMAIINNPSFLILDEPTRGLDEENIQILTQILKNIECDSILLITHDLYLAKELTSNIIIMKDGEILAQKPAQEFFSDPGESYSRYFLEAANKTKPVN